MGKIDPSIPGCSFTQSSDEIQKILNNVAGLSDENVSELISLLNEIKNYNPDPTDDANSIGQQLLAVLDSMVKEDEIQTELNDSTYPPQTKLVKQAIDSHKTETVLDHPDGSVTTKKLADKAVGSGQIDDGAVTNTHLAAKAVTADKIANGTIDALKLTDTLAEKIRNSINSEILYDYISTISKAAKYKLSELRNVKRDVGYEIPVVETNYFILKNDTGSDFNDGNGIPYNDLYSWFPDKTIRSGKTYFCLLWQDVDWNEDVLKDGEIKVIMEMGSDIIDLQSASKNWVGVWHYGTELTHTENLGDSVTNNTIKGNVGDFYLNKNTFAVYFCVGDDTNNHNWLYIGNLTGSVDTSKWAPITSPDFKGTPMADTPAVTNNSRQFATTAFVRNAIDKYGNLDVNTWAKLVSPSFTGIPTAPTATTTNNSSQIATTEFVRNAIIRYASGGDNTGNIGNILVPLFLSQVNVTVNIWVSDESPMYIGEITNVTATKSWIAASTPTIDYKTTTWSATELTDMVLYCQITNVGIYVGICSENNVPYGALTSALPNSVGSTVVTLI